MQCPINNNNNKRRREISSAEPQAQALIGPTELCHILQSRDEPQVVRLGLRRFTARVKAERALALHLETRLRQHQSTCPDATTELDHVVDDDLYRASDSESDDELEDDDPETTLSDRVDRLSDKKLKPEDDWKRDTRNYNVPFVGTSIAREHCPVVEGIWPTGLLYGYLNRSPQAVELIHLLDSVASPALLRKLSRSPNLLRTFQKTHLDSLSELVTAIIPMHMLFRSSDNKTVVKDATTKEEESCSLQLARLRQNLIKIGLSHAIQLLQDATQKSTTPTTTKTSGGDKDRQELTRLRLVSSILRFLSRMASVSSRTARQVAVVITGDGDAQTASFYRRFLVPIYPKKEITGDSNEDGGNISRSAQLVFRTRVSIKRRWIELAAVLVQYRDVGILATLASLRHPERKQTSTGLLYTFFEKGLDLDDAIKNRSLVNSVTQLIAEVHSCLILQQGNSVSRIMVDLWRSKDCLSNLVQITSFAPPVSDYKLVLTRCDAYDDIALEPLSHMAVVCRRLLYWLLSNSRQSSLLSSKTVPLQTLVRTLLSLWRISSDVETQHFLILCIETTPSLQPMFFHQLLIPDLEIRRGLPYCQTLRFLIRCLHATTARNQKNVATFWPTHLRKAVVHKALGWNQNPLVITVTLHFLVAALHQDWVEDAEVNDLRTKSLPDVMAVARVITSAWTGSRCDHTVTYLGAFAACQVLPRLVHVYNGTTNMDWVKCLVPSGPAVTEKPLWLQRALMQCLEGLIKLELKHKNVPLRSSLDEILHIMLSTKDSLMYQFSRRIALSLLPFRQGTSQEMQYEYACWIDGVSFESVKEFCALVRLSSENEVKSKLAVMNAWNKCNLPENISFPNVSPMIVQAVQSSDHSVHFELLLCQVATKCILHSSLPLPVAALFANCEAYARDSLHRYERNHLIAYSLSLISFDHREDTGRLHSLGLLVQSIFTDNCLLNTLINKPNKQIVHISHNLESYRIYFRELLHYILIVNPFRQKAIMNSLVHKFLPLLLMLNSSEDSRWLVERVISLADGLIVSPIIQRSINVLQSSGNIWYGQCDVFWNQCLELDNFRPGSSVSQPGTTAAYVYFVGPFVPVQCLSIWTSLVLDNLSNRKLSQEIGILYLRRVMSTEVFFNACTLEFVRSVFDTWKSYSLDSSQIKSDLLFYLDQLLCSLLSSELPVEISMELELKFSSLSGEAVVQQCYDSKQRNGPDPKCLLTALIQRDAVMYSCIVLHDIEAKGTLLRSGNFHEAILSTIRCHEVAMAHKQAMIEVTLHYLDLVILILSGPMSTSLDLVVLSKILTELLNSFAWSDILVQKRTDLLENTLTTLLRSSCTDDLRDVAGFSIGSFGGSDQVLILQFAVRVSLHHSKLQSPIRQNLVGALVVCLVRHLLASDHMDENRFLFVGSIYNLLESYTSVLDASAWSCVVFPSLRFCIMLGMRMNVEAIGYHNELSLLRLVNLLLLKVGWEMRVSSKSVVSMIVNHSHFPLLMNLQVDDPAVCIKSHVLGILVLCCSTQSDAAQIDESTCMALLQGFDGGTSVCDYRIRRLMQLQSLRDIKTSNFLNLTRIRWRSAPNATSDDDWNWLPEAIEMRRVQATLTNFPLLDSLEVSDHQSAENDTFSSLVYSPGFLLPHILACLEAAASDGTIASMAHRLCEKGGLALALASLCSNCMRVRYLAVAVLCEFTSVSGSDESKQYSNWRSRPQVSLMLTSLQKSLYIRASESQEGTYCIPKLPGHSAIFLARASLILARPSDDLFPAINRYFLQSVSDHGAFHDLFRVPAFMSLLSSASPEKPGHAHEHREWAWKLIRDGFLDSHSYKLLTSCHAPELLLTSIDTFTNRHGLSAASSSEELHVMLSVLLRILETSGSQVHEILIGRLGILFWLKSVLLGSYPNNLLPSDDEECRYVFLQIVSLSTQHALVILDAEVMANWCKSCAQPVVDFIVSSIGCRETTIGPQHQQLSKRMSCISMKVFSHFRRIMKEEIVGSSTQNSDGLDLGCIRSLLSVSQASERGMLFVAICRIPWVIQSTTHCSSIASDLVDQIVDVLEACTPSGNTEGEMFDLCALTYMESLMNSYNDVETTASAFSRATRRLMKVNLQSRFNLHAATREKYRFLVANFLL